MRKRYKNVEAGRERTRATESQQERAGHGLPRPPARPALLTTCGAPPGLDGAVVSAWPSLLSTVFGNVLGTPNSAAPGKRCGSRSSEPPRPPTLLCPGACRPGTGGSGWPRHFPRERDKEALCVPRQKTGVFGGESGTCEVRDFERRRPPDALRGRPPTSPRRSGPFFCWGISCVGVRRSPRPSVRRDPEYGSVQCVFRKFSSGR